MSDPRIITDNLGHHFQMGKRGNKYTAVYNPKLPNMKQAHIKSSLGGAYGLSEETRKAMRKVGSDVAYTSPEIRNPLLNIVNFYLPTNYKILNQWLRYYDRFHPIVGNCIDMHAEFPICQFDLDGIDDPVVLHTYEDAATDMDLFQTLLSGSREIELIGEWYPFAHWNDEKNYFDNVTTLNPDFVAVNQSQFSYGSPMQFELEPDEDLKRLVHSTDPRDMELKAFLDPIVLRCIEDGVNIPIDPFNVHQLARKASPYDPRGTSIVLRALKDLLYEDKLREAQYAVADGHITPKQIWKLGDPQNGYMPTDDDISDFIQLLQASAHDPMFAIVSHYGLQFEMIGATGRILPIIPEMEFTTSRILMALYTSRSAIQGEGPTWSSGPVVAFEILQGRYMAKREKLENWLMQKIWIPIALANGFYKPITKMSGGGNARVRIAGQERELLLPTLRWKQKLELVDDNQKKNYADMARNRLDISYSTWARIMGYNEKYELERLDKEKGTLADPQFRKQITQEEDLRFQKKLKENGLVEKNKPAVVPGEGDINPPGYGNSPGRTNSPQRPSSSTDKEHSKNVARRQFGGQEDRIKAIKKAELGLIKHHEDTSQEREVALAALTKFETEIEQILGDVK